MRRTILTIALFAVSLMIQAQCPVPTGLTFVWNSPTHSYAPPRKLSFNPTSPNTTYKFQLPGDGVTTYSWSLSAAAFPGAYVNYDIYLYTLGAFGGKLETNLGTLVDNKLGGKPLHIVSEKSGAALLRSLTWQKNPYTSPIKIIIQASSARYYAGIVGGITCAGFYVPIGDLNSEFKVDQMPRPWVEIQLNGSTTGKTTPITMPINVTDITNLQYSLNGGAWLPYTVAETFPVGSTLQVRGTWVYNGVTFQPRITTPWNTSTGTTFNTTTTFTSTVVTVSSAIGGAVELFDLPL